MSNLLIQDKAIVVPGELLAQGMDFLPSFGTYRVKEDIRAARLGMAKVEGKVLKIIPLSGRYIPKRGDVILGPVTDIMLSGWRQDTNSPYSAVLGMKDATSEFIERGADLSRYYALGDYLVTKVINVTSQKLVDVTMRGPGLHKLTGGRIIEVNPNKVPRIIGKQGSMVGMIKDMTGLKIVVGQNGIIWLEGEPRKENIAVEAIRKIERDGHHSGLTDKIKEFLASRMKEGS